MAVKLDLVDLLERCGHDRSHDPLENLFELVTGIDLSGRRALVDSSARAVEFEKKYEEDYGSVHVPFFHGSFEQAKEEAKRSKALLIACFLSRQHPVTPLFLQEALGDPKTAQTFSNTEKIIVWVGDVYYSDTYHRACQFELYQFPAVLYLAYVEHRLVPLLSLQGGTVGASHLLDRALELLEALEAHGKALSHRASSLSVSQRIREEQDAAYQLSLAADAKKEEERRRAEAAERERKEAELRSAQELANCKAQRETLLNSLRERLPEEGTDAENVLRLSLQLPDGQREIRKFNPNDKLVDLYNWAFTLVGRELAVGEGGFVIRTMLPPVLFEKSDKTLVDAGIQNQMKLIVELKNTF